MHQQQTRPGGTASYPPPRALRAREAPHARARPWITCCPVPFLTSSKREQIHEMTDSKIESAKKLLATGVPRRDVAKNLGVSVPTLYRWIPASAQA